MSEDGALSPLEENAAALARTALAIGSAQDCDDRESLNAALDLNLHLWVALRTLAGRPDSPLPQAIRENLVRLSHYVTGLLAGDRAAVGNDDLETLINTNLQISEGLLEGLAVRGDGAPAGVGADMAPVG